MGHSWEGVLCDRFRERRGRFGGGEGGIYGALDLECFGVGDIVGGELDGAGGKGCEKGLGERELRHGEGAQAGCL